MIEPAFPANEAARLCDLHQLDILDTPPQERFDRITRMAARLLDVPIAVISLVDADRQWFKSCLGLSVSETPRDISFCAHAILEKDTFVIPDARLDARFAGNPLVTGEPGVRFYAGHPIKGPSGHPVGVLCVIDRRPRQASRADLQALQDLAAFAEIEMSNFKLGEVLQVQRAAEQQLQTKTRQLNNIFENLDDVFFSVDTVNQQVLEMSPGCNAIYGLPPEAFFANPMLWYEVILPEDRPIVDANYAPLMAGQPVLQQYRITRADGRTRWIETRLKPTLDEGGRFVRLEGINSDITERKEMERMKDELISTVSHELRTPLTSLRGFAELMLARNFAPEKQREFLTIIHKETIRLTELINDFLDLQRLESGRQTYDLAEVDLASLVREQAALFTADKSRHSISLEMAADLPPAWADSDRLRQVLSNLFSNAVKFSPDGGEISVGARREDTEVLLWVRDHGLGIPPEALPHLFQKFFRVSNERTRHIGGTGLGLALVKQIVEAQRGRVWVESAPGQGSTFYLTLPAAEPAAPVPVRATAGVDILLVENDPAYTRLLREHFLGAGLSVAATASAREALVHAGNLQPRLIMTDIHLVGEMDGWDLLIALKRDVRLQDIPVMVLTASESNIRGLALCGADYLLKPLDTDAFLQIVRRQLSSLAGKSMLVADDDPSFRRQAAELIETAGGRVSEAADGQETLEHIARRMPDLLILDLLMPGTDGFEVLRRLRADRRAANLPVVVVTGKELSSSEKAYIKRRLAILVDKRADAAHITQRAAQLMSATPGSAERQLAS